VAEKGGDVRMGGRVPLLLGDRCPWLEGKEFQILGASI